MIILAGTLLVSLATSLYPDARPDTGAPVDSVRFRQAYADTVQDLQVTSDVSADRRIRLSLRGGAVGKPISTPWIPADTVDRWLDGVYSAVTAHEWALTGISWRCVEYHGNTSRPADTVAGRLFGLASSLGVTPITVETLPAYRVDVMDAGDDRTATFAVGLLDLKRFTRVLTTAVKATQLLSDEELRKNGPLAVRIAEPARAATPVYPESPRQAGIEGDVHMCFVIDTTGRADKSTLIAFWSTGPQFTRAVRNAIKSSRYVVPSIEGHSYKEQVTQAFHFTIDGVATAVRDRRNVPWINTIWR